MVNYAVTPQTFTLWMTPTPFTLACSQLPKPHNNKKNFVSLPVLDRVLADRWLIVR